jgi:hypothetical protein
MEVVMFKRIDSKLDKIRNRKTELIALKAYKKEQFIKEANIKFNEWLKFDGKSIQDELEGLDKILEKRKSLMIRKIFSKEHVEFFNKQESKFKYFQKIIVKNPIENKEYLNCRGRIVAVNFCKGVHKISKNCYFVKLYGVKGKQIHFEENELRGTK